MADRLAIDPEQHKEVKATAAMAGISLQELTKRIINLGLQVWRDQNQPQTITLEEDFDARR